MATEYGDRRRALTPEEWDKALPPGVKERIKRFTDKPSELTRRAVTIEFQRRRSQPGRKGEPIPEPPTVLVRRGIAARCDDKVTFSVSDGDVREKDGGRKAEGEQKSVEVPLGPTGIAVLETWYLGNSSVQNVVVEYICTDEKKKPISYRDLMWVEVSDRNVY